MRAVMLLTCLAAAAAPALHGQAREMPPVIRAGLEIYKVKGANAAVARWMTGSAITDASSVIQELAKIEGFFGRMVGYEVLDVVPFGTYVERTYLIILYEKGPVYFWFDCYLPKSEWVVTAVLFNTKADMILPAKMLSH